MLIVLDVVPSAKLVDAWSAGPVAPVKGFHQFNFVIFDCAPSERCKHALEDL